MVETQVAGAGAGVDDNVASPDPNVTFATDLLFNLDDVRANCATSLAAHASLITMLQSRTKLEKTYAYELSKMACSSPRSEMEHGTMKIAMASLRAQYLNTSVQHQQLAKNLEEDVLKPIESLYECIRERSQSLARRIKNAKKDVKIQEDAYRKVYSTFDKNFRDASASFSAAIASGFSSTLLEDQYHRRLSQIEVEDSPAKTHSSIATMIRPDKSSGTIALKTINNNKLVSWLLSSETHRKEDLAKNTIKLLEAAEKARRKCQHSWQTVEAHRIKMHRVVQAVLADYQQIAEDRISIITTNLRKHVVFASSTLANEQYDWQVTAPKFEVVDVKSDIYDFIHTTRGKRGRVDSTVNDLCNNTTRALVSSPSSKPCRPLRKTCLEIRDISSKIVPFDHDGNQEVLSEVLGSHHPRALGGTQDQQQHKMHDHELWSRDGYACLRVDCSMPSTENDVVGNIEVTALIEPTIYNGVGAQSEDKNLIVQHTELEHGSDEN